MDSIGQHNLYKICHLYYLEGQTQQEISAAFGISRFKVGRLLKKARQEGLVTVQINGPDGDLTEKEIKLAQNYGLKQTLIVRKQQYNLQSHISRIGTVGARYLSSIIDRCRVLGVAWGRSVSHVVQNVEPGEVKDVTVVQMTGGMGAIAGTDATALTMALGQKLRANAHVIQAPAIVGNRTIRDALLKEKQIFEAISLAKKADAAIFGIGLPNENGLLSRSGLLTKNNMTALENAGVVGAICGRFFDIKGQKCTNAIDNQIIGLNLNELKRIKHKVAIAFGSRKINAILGALRGQLLDVLITDDKTANALLGRS